MKPGGKDMELLCKKGNEEMFSYRQFWKVLVLYWKRRYQRSAHDIFLE